MPIARSVAFGPHYKSLENRKNILHRFSASIKTRQELQRQIDSHHTTRRQTTNSLDGRYACDSINWTLPRQGRLLTKEGIKYFDSLTLPPQVAHSFVESSLTPMLPIPTEVTHPSPGSSLIPLGLIPPPPHGCVVPPFHPCQLSTLQGYCTVLGSCLISEDISGKD